MQKTLLLVVVGLLCIRPATAQEFTLTQDILFDTANSRFGQAIAVSDSTAVVACKGCSPSGAALVYEFDGSQWSEIARLTPSSPVSGASFAQCVDIDGDVIVIGNQVNRVYVYEKPNGGWADATETAILSPSSPSAYTKLGTRIAIDDRLIGVFEDQTNRILLYERSGSNWVSGTETAHLTVPNLNQLSSNFGFGFDVLSDVVLVNGGDGELLLGSGDPLPGFIFERPSTGWANTNVPTVILSSPLTQAASPQQAVLTENYAFLAFRATGMPVHVYKKPDGGWSAADTLTPAALLSPKSNQTTQFYGFWMDAKEDNLLAVGDYGASSNTGLVEIFQSPCSGWEDTVASYTLVAETPAANDRYGVGVALSKQGDLLVGADFADVNGTNNTGRVYAYLQNQLDLSAVEFLTIADGQDRMVRNSTADRSNWFWR